MLVEDERQPFCDMHGGEFHKECRLKDCIMHHSSCINSPFNISYRYSFRNIIKILYYVIFLYFPICCEGFCPSKCICEYDLLRVRCTNASLDLVPMLLSPEIEALSLPCNNIESIEQSLDFYPELKNVDLSYNQIKSIDSSDFRNQEKLITLNLHKNKIGSVQNKSFVPLNALKELFLSYNSIEQVEPNSFANLKELKSLDISNNKLRSLPSNTFSTENTLHSIKLSFNNFKYVPSNALSRVRHLSDIDLTGNLLSEVNEGAFNSLNNLSSIILDKNNIQNLYPDSFKGLDKLRSLSLKDNRLSTIEGISFQPLKALQNLDVSGNIFQDIQRNAFSSLTSLVHLRITRCPRLYRIDSDAFANLFSLETLQLNHNARLVYLGDSVFSSLKKLKDLDLTACGLNYVNPNQMPRNKETKLHLAGNPLHCNCSLMWLAEFTYNDSYYLDAPTCATPPKLYGVPVHKVNLRSAGCQHQLGLTAIGTCVGVVLLGLLVIAIFLAWRWSKKSLNSNKTLPGANERGIRETWPGGGRPPLPPPPPGPIVYQGAPPNNIYSPKYCIPSQVSIPSCGHTQCQGVCQAITQHPYTLHPVTRPLLTPPSPSINSQTHIPIDWLYPSPYDDDTHWYTTIGRDGREYLTGEIKRDHPSPPPLPQDSPPPNLTSLPPSSPTLSSVKRGNSFSQSSTSTSQGTPTLKNRPMPPTLALKEDLINSDRQRIPVTYI